MVLRSAVRVCLVDRHHLQTTPPTQSLRRVLLPDRNESAGFCLLPLQPRAHGPPTKRGDFRKPYLVLGHLEKYEADFSHPYFIIKMKHIQYRNCNSFCFPDPSVGKTHRQPSWLGFLIDNRSILTSPQRFLCKQYNRA